MIRIFCKEMTTNSSSKMYQHLSFNEHMNKLTPVKRQTQQLHKTNINCGNVKIQLLLNSYTSVLICYVIKINSYLKTIFQLEL